MPGQYTEQPKPVTPDQGLWNDLKNSDMYKNAGVWGQKRMREKLRDKVITSNTNIQRDELPAANKAFDRITVGADVSEDNKSYLEILKEEAGQTVGGIAGGLAGAVKGAPLGPWGIVGGGALGSFIGGAGGEGYQQVYEHSVNDADAPNNALEAAHRMGVAGSEELLYDVVGSALGIGAKAVGRKLMPVGSKGVNEMGELLESYGGHFTAAQRTNNWLVHQLDSLTRGSMSGQHLYKKVDLTNNTAMMKWQTDFSETMAKRATDTLSDGEVGRLFLDSVTEGKAAHGALVGNLYSQFDTMVPSQIVAGQKVPPIDVSNLTKLATSMKDDFARRQNVGVGDIGADFLTKMSKQGTDITMPDGTVQHIQRMTFGDAQALRSDVLAMQRGLKNSPENAKVGHRVSEFIDALTKSMDDAAKEADKLGQYEQIKKLARTGYSTFNDKFIADLLAEKTSQSIIGDHVFRTSNVDQIPKVKDALIKAARYSGGKIDSRKVWAQMQRGWIEGILAKSVTEVSSELGESLTEFEAKSGLANAKLLLKQFNTPRDFRVLKEVLTTNQREALHDFAKTLYKVQQKPQGGLGMVMQISQGGAIAGLAGGVIKAGEAASLFIAPYVLSHMLTRPHMAKWLTRTVNTPVSSTFAPQILTKLTTLIEQAKQELGEED